jgi:2-polyprenyl-3-methyl-5-hydroxy-6-metoxy-1,4-benzoquinol methylase
MEEPIRVEHWRAAHRAKAARDQSWHQTNPALSLELITEVASPGASVLDVGSGASALPDRLLDLGYHVGVLDIAAEALQLTKKRLAARAHEVEWFEGDVTGFRATHPWDVWHDRAVFHFLIEESDRRAYRERAEETVTPGGSLILATFSERGPERCSGLPTLRYSAEALAAEMGQSFRLETTRSEEHRTPAGRTQDFLYARFRRI